LHPEKNVLFWTMTACVMAGLAGGILMLGSRGFSDLAFKISRRLLPKKWGLGLARLETAWRETHDFFWRDRARLARVAGTSVCIWFLHLLQIWMFMLALRAHTPLLASLALSPLAILAGLLPLTFAGVGTRDAALIFFFRHQLDTPTAAALGILCTMRYVLPAIGGLPFIPDYLPGLRTMKKQDVDK
jgi:uncharacterized membrane protein YbhN (UPF0104 family)